MISMQEQQKAIDAIKQAKTITILSHLNPDADALGTALGIYAMLHQDKTKRVEVVNASTVLPLELDFLPHYKKIKQRMEYEESLVIACDCGSIDRLGFALDKREILNIDHHASNTAYGSINIIYPTYASSSQVAYDLLKEDFSIDADVATCFYTALLSDTRYFTANSVNKEVFSVAMQLLEKGANPKEVAYNLTQRRSLASFRILEKALHSLSLTHDAKVAVLFVTKEDIASTGATMPDMEGIVDYARSLVTVEVALFMMETDEGIRVSLRSKQLDISSVAAHFGGGGHRVAAGFTLKQTTMQKAIDKVLTTIDRIIK